MLPKHILCITFKGDLTFPGKEILPMNSSIIGADRFIHQLPTDLNLFLFEFAITSLSFVGWP